MPEINFSDPAPMPSIQSQFIKLEKKGESIKFRLTGKPFFTARHWVNQKDPVDCPRINNKEECEYCKKFDNGEIPPGVDAETGRNWYKPNVTFYYPIVNRDTHEAQIFQTSPSVHIAIKENNDAGIDVFKSDWKITRNEGSPANYYGVVRLDSTPLTKEEKEALEEAKKIDLTKIFSGGRSSSLEPSEESPSEKEELPSEEPF